MNDNKYNKPIEEMNDTECITEMCRQKPHLVLRTQCGVGKYMFSNFCYRNDQFVLEFKLIQDENYKDSDKILYHIGEVCYLTASQYLYAYEYQAVA